MRRSQRDHFELISIRRFDVLVDERAGHGKTELQAPSCNAYPIHNRPFPTVFANEFVRISIAQVRAHTGVNAHAGSCRKNGRQNFRKNFKSGIDFRHAFMYNK